MASFSLKQIDRLNNRDTESWIRIANNSDGTTIFHLPKFLAYHSNRFNEFHQGFYKGNELIGLIPLAIIHSKHGFSEARSPYGASYGGFIFSKDLNYRKSKEIVTLFIQYLTDNKINRCIITPQLPVYYHEYNQTFLFALLEQDFKLINSDIVSVIHLQKDISELLSTRVKRLKKNKLPGLRCVLQADTNDFWAVLEKTFAKHGTAPTHSKQQWQWLAKHLPERVWCDVAYIDNFPVSGIGHFLINGFVDSAFYICSDPAFQESQALTLLIVEIIEEAKKQGRIWFDLGTSSVNMIARPNIFEFKENFGAIGVLRNTYSLGL